MAFNPNIPTAPQKLSVSQPLLLANNQQLDTSFAIDHYAFSDATANNGFHNQVTTPNHASGADPTTTTNPILYAIENTVNLGSLQYSRGPNDIAPTPVTSLQSTIAPVTIGTSSSINILDFTGISIALCSFFCHLVQGSSQVRAEYFVTYRFNVSAFTSIDLVAGTNNLISFSTNTLQMINVNTLFAMTDVFWTLKFYRVQKI